MDVDTRNLTVRYLAVLAIIGLVSMVGQGLLNHRLAQQQEVSARINGAGRQRMLSQRLGHLLLRSPAEAVVLEAVLEEWVATHSALVSQPNSMGVFGSNNTDMQRRIDDLIPSFSALEQAVLARDIPAFFEEESRYLERMDAVVLQLEAEDQLRVIRLRRASFAALAFLLGLLVWSGWFIFAPAVRDLRQSMIRRREAEDALVEVASLERRRIGQALHDELGSRLAGVSLLARSGAPGGTLADEVDRALVIIRGLGQGLNPETELVDGLGPGLEQLVERSRLLNDGEVDAHIDITCRPKNDVALNLFCIAQEMLWNAVQHAEADLVGLQFTCHHDGCTLAVWDTGKGFDPDATDARRMGLAIIYSRARRIGAGLKLDSKIGKGTRVVCTLHAKGLEADSC